MEIFRNEEVFCEEPPEPCESVQLIQLDLLEEVGHASETADAKHTQRHVVAGHSRSKVHLQTQQLDIQGHVYSTTVNQLVLLSYCKAGCLKCGKITTMLNTTEL